MVITRDEIPRRFRGELQVRISGRRVLLFEGHRYTPEELQIVTEGITTMLDEKPIARADAMYMMAGHPMEIIRSGHSYLHYWVWILDPFKKIPYIDQWDAGKNDLCIVRYLDFAENQWWSDFPDRDGAVRVHPVRGCGDPVREKHPVG